MKKISIIIILKIIEIGGGGLLIYGIGAWNPLTTYLGFGEFPIEGFFGNILCGIFTLFSMTGVIFLIILAIGGFYSLIKTNINFADKILSRGKNNES